jgi:nucleoside-diphosphate-sugar epimerase
MTKSPTVALLGCGYTLSTILALNPSIPAVVTSTSEDKVDRLRQAGLDAVRLDLTDDGEVARFFRERSEVTTIIDGVPPVFGRDTDPLSGVRNVVAHGRAATRLIYLSTTGVFGGQDGSWVDESTPPNPRHPRARARWESEALYTEAFPSSCMLRIPAIYGPGRGVGVSMKRGSYRMIGDGSRWTNRVHVVDLARTITALLFRSPAEPLPPVLCVSDGAPATAREVTDYYRERFGFSEPPSVTEAEAVAAGMYTQTGNQRVANRLLTRYLPEGLKYPSFRDGAGSEFEPPSSLGATVLVS